MRNLLRDTDIALSEGVNRYAVDRALATWKFKNPHTMMRENFLGTSVGIQYMILDADGTPAFNFPNANAFATWPVWLGTDGLDSLEHLLAEPIATVSGQPHRVIISNPGWRTPEERKYTLDVRALCANYPDAMIHLTGTDSYELMFGLEWDSVDIQLNYFDDDIHLPHGMKIVRDKWEQAWYWQDWIEMLGFKPEQLTNPANRTERFRFNVRSAKWAAENYNSEDRIRRKYSPTRTIVMEKDVRARDRARAQRDAQWRNAKTVAKRSLHLLGEKVVGDYSHCDHCIVRATCNLARAGMVCALKETEMGELSRLLGTRNTDLIIDGLVKLIGAQADRTEEAIAAERMSGDGPTSPEVTRQINALFKNGTLLAKLIDPKLNGGATITNNTLNVNGGATPANNPRALIAEIVKQLELAGIPRDQITPDMIKTMLANGANQPALEGVVIQQDMQKE